MKLHYRHLVSSRGVVAVLGVCIAVFTILSLWNSHTALSQTLWPRTASTSNTSPLHPGSGNDLTTWRATAKNNRGTPLVMPRLPQPVCLTDACLTNVARGIARSYPSRPKDSWCIPVQTRNVGTEYSLMSNKTWQGLLLVKVPKAASSTSAGLVLRMANRTDGGCAVQWEHREGRNYAQRVPNRSLLIGSVRQPAARSLSAVWFFMLAPLNITPTDANIIRSLHTHRGGKTKGKGGYQFVYLSLEDIEPRSVWTPHSPTYVMDPPAVHAHVQTLLQSYDFLLVVERMDESLTALALLTGLPLSHVLVTNSKVAGSYLLVRPDSPGRQKAGTCHRQIKGPLSDGVRQYVESDEWRAMNYADEILFRAANASLDLTIAAIGTELFARKLEEFQRLKAKVLQACGSRLGFGCSDQGIPLPEEQCYLRDFGCGYSCVDAVVDGLVDEDNHQDATTAVRGGGS